MLRMKAVSGSLYPPLLLRIVILSGSEGSAVSFALVFGIGAVFGVISFDHDPQTQEQQQKQNKKQILRFGSG